MDIIMWRGIFLEVQLFLRARYGNVVGCSVDCEIHHPAQMNLPPLVMLTMLTMHVCLM